jgi:hypothetical protein
MNAIPIPIPIVCAWCERVRTGGGQWENAEPAELASTQATHGICPDCLAEETRAASVSAESRW